MKNKLIKELTQELHSLILQGHNEVKKTGIKDSIEQKFELKKMTIFCVEEFKNNLYKNRDKINLTKFEIDHVASDVSQSYLTIEIDDEANNESLPGIIHPDDYEKIIRLFYKFCYDKRITSLILGDTYDSEVFKSRLLNTTSHKDTPSFDLFRKYAKIENVNVDMDDYPNQVYNSLYYTIEANRIIIDGENHYLEVLTNNFFKLSYSDLVIAIPNNFIIQVKNHKPVGIYVVLQNLISDGFTVRKVHDNGIISNLGRIKDNSFDTFTSFFRSKN